MNYFTFSAVAIVAMFALFGFQSYQENQLKIAQINAQAKCPNTAASGVAR